MTPRSWLLAVLCVAIIAAVTLTKMGKLSPPYLLLSLLVVLWALVAAGAAQAWLNQGVVNWLLIGTFATVLLMTLCGALFDRSTPPELKRVRES